MLPGEGQLPQLGRSWEHYKAAKAPPREVIDDIFCHMRADMTFYTCEERYEEAAANVIDTECKRLL